ncbi:MAG TPA: biopolymer transporter ExbD [Chthoniobacterales bacterium]
MRLTRSPSLSPFLFQIVPLLNVLFALLVFFILGSTFVLQPGIAINPPTSQFAMEPARNPVIISVLAGTPPQLFLRDQIVSQDQLTNSLADPAMSGRTIIVKADRAVPYDVVMRISNDVLSHGLPVILATEPAVAK